MAFSRTVAHATAADGTFSAAGVLAWDGVGAHTPAVTDATSGGIPYFSSTTAEASSALLAQYGVVIGGGAGAAPATQSGLTFGGAAAGTGLAIAAGTATTNNNANALNISQTWNAAGVTFTGKKTNITATAYTSGSLIEDWQIGGTSTAALIKNTNNVEFRVGPAGELDTSSGYNFLHVNGSTAGVITTSNGGTRRFNMYHDNTSMLYQGVVTVSGTSHYFLAGNSTKVFRIFSQVDDADRGAVAGGSNAGYYLTDTAGVASATRDTGWSRISAGVWGAGTGAAGSFAGRIKLTSAIAAGVTVANLNAAPTTGEIQSVTDSLAPVAGAAVAAGGAAKALVWYNGAQWTVVAV